MRYLLMLCLLAWGCNSQEVASPSPVSEKAVADSQKDQALESKAPADRNSGSPVGKAVETMNRATKEMTEALLLIDKSRSKDVVVNCRDNPQAAFREIGEFLTSNAYYYNDSSFWFETAMGEQVGVDLNDGRIIRCLYGIFVTYKRVVAFQKQVVTEFFIDTRNGDLMVHKYVNGTRVDNKNYVLAR